MNEKLRETLKKLKDIFDEGSIPAVLNQAGEDGCTNDLLMVMYPDMGIDDNEVMGQFFFTGQDEEDSDQVLLNCCMILIEEIDPENIGAVYEMTAKLNYYLTGGRFGVDKTGKQLIYRSGLLLARDLSADEMFEKADSAAGLAMDMADSYVDAFKQVADGSGQPVETVLKSLALA